MIKGKKSKPHKAACVACEKKGEVLAVAPKAPTPKPGPVPAKKGKTRKSMCVACGKRPQ